MTDFLPFEPNWAVAPGETLAEWAEEHDPEHQQLVELYGGDREGVDALLCGRRELAPDDALSLERLTQIPATFWLAMEANYRADLARLGAAGRRGLVGWGA
jgi:HTH-type transcriptional regulator/antitoxin HigA